MIYFSFHDFNIYENIEKLDNHLLIIQNKNYLYSFLKNLHSGCSNNEYIKLFDQDCKPLKTIDFVEFIPSLIYLDINNKKNLNYLIRLLKKSNNEDLQITVNAIMELIQKTFNKIRLDSPIDIISDIKFSEDDLIKNMNILINDDDSSLIERINTFIKISFELRNIKIFVFYGLFTLLQPDEIEMLINTCKYNAITLIDVEAENISTNIFNKKKILDIDNCLLDNI